MKKALELFPLADMNVEEPEVGFTVWHEHQCSVCENQYRSKLVLGKQIFVCPVCLQEIWITTQEDGTIIEGAVGPGFAMYRGLPSELLLETGTVVSTLTWMPIDDKFEKVKPQEK